VVGGTVRQANGGKARRVAAAPRAKVQHDLPADQGRGLLQNAFETVGNNILCAKRQFDLDNFKRNRFASLRHSIRPRHFAL
ncbi:hypothetical protein J8J07_21635, partial [Mycobacterium tuberculosis]|nr:hypothetical protein [Mycobacterium tuberculosis]